MGFTDQKTGEVFRWWSGVEASAFGEWFLCTGCIVVWADAIAGKPAMAVDQTAKFSSEHTSNRFDGAHKLCAHHRTLWELACQR
jgi:hypothetical protein